MKILIIKAVVSMLTSDRFEDKKNATGTRKETKS